MSVQKFHAKPIEVEALQWSGNETEMKAFASGDWCEDEVWDAEDQDWYYVQSGDWVVKEGDVFHCIKEADFAKRYTWARGPIG